MLQLLPTGWLLPCSISNGKIVVTITMSQLLIIGITNPARSGNIRRVAASTDLPVVVLVVTDRK